MIAMSQPWATDSQLGSNWLQKKKNSKNQEIQENHVLSPFPAKSIRIPYVFWPELAGGTPSPDSPAPHQLSHNTRNPYAFGWKWRQYMIFLIFMIFALFLFFSFFFVKPVTTQLAAWWKATPVLPAQSFFFPPGSSFEILLLTLP